MIVGRGVLVPPRVARVLLVRAGLEDYRLRCKGEDTEVDTVLEELRAEVFRWHQAVRTRHTRDSTDDQPSLLISMTTREAAKLVGCSLHSIQRACKARKLPARLVGGRYLVDVVDAEQYRATRRAA